MGAAMSTSMIVSSDAEDENTLYRFPLKAVLADPLLRRAFPQMLWLVVPVAYYYVTTISSGFNSESYIPTAAYVVLLVTSMALSGGAVAVVLRPWKTDAYFEKARGLVATLLSIWSLAISLECLSYFVTSWFNPMEPKNIILSEVCSLQGFISCGSWIGSALSHIAYSCISAIVLVIVIRLLARPISSTKSSSVYDAVIEPRVWIAAPLVGVLMQCFDFAVTFVQ